MYFYQAQYSTENNEICSCAKNLEKAINKKICMPFFFDAYILTFLLISHSTFFTKLFVQNEFQATIQIA